MRRHRCSDTSQGIGTATTTEVASPTPIIEWRLQDDPVTHRVRALELQKLEAEAQVHGHMRMVGTRNDGPEGMALTVAIENTGGAGFSSTP